MPWALIMKKKNSEASIFMSDVTDNWLHLCKISDCHSCYFEGSGLFGSDAGLMD
jgi:hypothetical protein